MFQDAVLLALDDDRMVETEPLAVPLDDVGDVEIQMRVTTPDDGSARFARTWSTGRRSRRYVRRGGWLKA